MKASAALSANLRAVNWRTIGWDVVLQLSLALFVLKLRIGDVRPGYAFFEAIGAAVAKFLDFTNAGAGFVFGKLADQKEMARVFPDPLGSVPFIVAALPAVIFISSVFTVLYHLRILQLVVIADLGPCFRLHLLDGLRIQAAEVGGALRLERPPCRDGTGPAAFRVAVVEECIGPRADDRARKRRGTREVAAHNFDRAVLDPLQYLHESIHVHRFVQAVVDGLPHDRVVVRYQDSHVVLTCESSLAGCAAPAVAAGI